MKPLTYFALACLLGASLALAACGPKNVGEDVRKADDGSVHVGREPESQLRYPAYGNRLEQRLYYLNQPEVMVERMQRQRNFFDRRLNQGAPNTTENLTPRQQSPFRF